MNNVSLNKWWNWSNLKLWGECIFIFVKKISQILLKKSIPMFKIFVILRNIKLKFNIWELKFYKVRYEEQDLFANKISTLISYTCLCYQYKTKCRCGKMHVVSKTKKKSSILILNDLREIKLFFLVFLESICF